MNLSLSRLAERLRTSLWLVPALCVVAAMGLSVATEALDAHLSGEDSAWYLFRGGPEGAREVLSTVASSMMTFTGLVFSVTMLVLQQASNQYSPRVLRTFFKDRQTQFALGIFVGTFVYALLALRSVRGATSDIEDNVPALTIWLSVVLVLLCVGAFIAFLHHVAQSIRAVVIIHRIGRETRSALERMYPEGIGEDTEDPRFDRPGGLPSLLIPHPGDSGVLADVDAQALVDCLPRRPGLVVALVPMVGDFVAHGGTLFEVWGECPELDAKALLGAVRIQPERTLIQDAAFGFRLLVDIAERALSPGINDPTTALQSLDQLHDLLRRLVRRRFPSPLRQQEGGGARLCLRHPGWDAYVRLAVDEIRQYGEGSIQVARRLRHLLEDVLQVAPPFRRAELERQLALLEASVGRGFSDARERALARRPSPQGHGPS